MKKQSDFGWNSRDHVAKFLCESKIFAEKGHKFYDAKAVELVNKIDYDFSVGQRKIPP